MHATPQRPDVLTGNGEDPKLIVRLLSDANTWIGLRQKLEDQTHAIRAFCDGYSKYSGEDEDSSTLSKTTDTFWADVSARLDKLDASSAALIQLVSWRTTYVDETYHGLTLPYPSFSLIILRSSTSPR
jgi:hypothetical protein